MTAAVLKLQHSFVYAIGPKDGPQKVGIANRPERRLTGIQTGSHLVLEIAGTVEVDAQDARAIEATAHNLLSDRHIRGEWFDVSPEEALAAIEEAVAIIESGGAPPETACERVQIVMAPSDLNDIDAYRRTQADLPNRSKAIRDLVRMALDMLKREKRK